MSRTGHELLALRHRGKSVASVLLARTRTAYDITLLVRVRFCGSQSHASYVRCNMTLICGRHVRWAYSNTISKRTDIRLVRYRFWTLFMRKIIISSLLGCYGTYSKVSCRNTRECWQRCLARLISRVVSPIKRERIISIQNVMRNIADSFRNRTF